MKYLRLQRHLNVILDLRKCMQQKLEPSTFGLAKLYITERNVKSGTKPLERLIDAFLLDIFLVPLSWKLIPVENKFEMPDIRNTGFLHHFSDNCTSKERLEKRLEPSIFD